MHNTASGNRRVALTVRAAAVDWRPQQGSNLHLILRRNLFYPVELWGQFASVFYSCENNIASYNLRLYNA